jgi:cell division protease FtsH
MAENTQPSPYNGGNWYFILVLAALWFIVLALLLPSMSSNAVDLSYSEFKQQVRADNVSEVTVRGSVVTGTFRNAYQATGKPEAPTYRRFSTVLPSFQDPELLKLLEQHGVTIHAEQDNRSWLGPILISMLPWLLIIGLLWYSSKRMQTGFGGPGGLFGFAKSKAQRYRKTQSEVRFTDVAGLENAKKDLQEIIAYMKDPSCFLELGVELPRGILLMGPPGTGKTLLARAVAGEANVPFFSISGSEFIEMFVGVGAARVRDMFTDAKKAAPAIIFIDEIDSVGRIRGAGLGGGHDEREQTLNQILAEMDGFAPHEAVVVMAATNRPDVLDPALIRPGRFDRQVTLELPQKQARLDMLRLHTRHVPLAEDVDLANLAARTVGFSGADLKNLVNEAGLLAGRLGKHRVEADDFDQARDKITLGSEREEPLSEEEKQLVAYHEAGHALVARLLPGTDPVQKVTIIPRGLSLGATEQIPEKDRHNLGRQYLLDRLAVMLGGRVAVKLTFGDITSGAGNDLQQATQLARHMVCQWGMSERLGAVAFRRGEEHVFLGREMAQQKDFSEHTARLIDEEIRALVRDMEAKATGLLEQNRDKLDTLAQALLHHETLEAEDIDRLLGADAAPRQAKALLRTERAS